MALRSVVPRAGGRSPRPAAGAGALTRASKPPGGAAAPRPLPPRPFPPEAARGDSPATDGGPGALRGLAGRRGDAGAPSRPPTGTGGLSPPCDEPAAIQALSPPRARKNQHPARADGTLPTRTPEG